jgi:hypothetical protein
MNEMMQGFLLASCLWLLLIVIAQSLPDKKEKK